MAAIQQQRNAGKLAHTRVKRPTPKQLDKAHKRLDLMSNVVGVRAKEWAFRKKMAELKLAGLENLVSTEEDGNPEIDIAESADLDASVGYPVIIHRRRGK